MNTKKKRTADEEGNEPGKSDGEEGKEAEYLRIVVERLRKLMGGLRFCREEELPRAVLLEFLKSKGQIEEVDGFVEVTVHA